MECSPHLKLMYNMQDYQPVNTHMLTTVYSLYSHHYLQRRPVHSEKNRAANENVSQRNYFDCSSARCRQATKSWRIITQGGTFSPPSWQRPQGPGWARGRAWWRTGRWPWRLGSWGSSTTPGRPPWSARRRECTAAGSQQNLPESNQGVKQ